VLEGSGVVHVAVEAVDQVEVVGERDG